MKALLPLLLLLLAGPALADDLDDRATAVFRAAFAEACTAAFAEDGSLAEPPERHDVTAPTSYGGEPEAMVLWQFRCNIGAYNLQSVFLAQSAFNGIVPLSFAHPDLDVVLEDPDNEESAVKAVNIVGWSSSPFVVNGVFDPASGTISAQGLWRGLGDASDASVWKLIDEGFRLVRFDVDASYDGQVNPRTLLNYQ